jgi:phosphatidylglycerol---prolipoprotein diacylglyceryl transferase
MPFAYWVHHFDPFLIKFSESFGIRYYGLAYLAGFLAAGWLLYLYWRKGRSPHGLNTISDLMTYIVLGVLIGGRLGYFLLYQSSALRTDPLGVFRVWEGGMASHGGFVGVLIAMWWWSRKRQAPFLSVSDLVVTTAPVGIFFGRIANFINGELVGKPASVPWAVIFPRNEIDEALGQSAVPRHPSQLYQATLEGLVLLAYMQWRFWRSSAQTRPGQLSGEFLIAYAVVRVIGEIFREPDASLLFGVSRGTFYSIFLIIAGVALILKARRQPAAPVA